jgi:hypothetical protein
MAIIFAIIAWILWIAVSTISGWIFYRFFIPKDISPKKWVQDLFPAAEFIVRTNVFMILTGIIVSIIISIVYMFMGV